MVVDKIYTLIIVEIVLQGLMLVGIVLGIILSRKNSTPKNDSGVFNAGASRDYYNPAAQQQFNAAASSQVTYCKKCANEYDASLWICPYCGTPR